MFKRVFKTIFILSLCFSTVTNTQAAVTQVSEGSSFITKAEFTSLVNEASGRIEALELHVDTKINELVESFLARNNIWHPQKQTLTANNSMIVKPATVTLSGGKIGKTFVIGDRTQCIEQIRKSGLMIISLYYSIADDSSTGNTFKWGYMGNMNNDGNWTSDNGTEVVVNFFEADKAITNYTDSNLDKKYTCLVGTTQGAKRQPGTGSANRGYTLAFALSSIKTLIPAYFFVTKNKQLVWDIEQLVKFCLTDDVYKVCNGENGGQDLKVWIEESIVY